LDSINNVTIERADFLVEQFRVIFLSERISCV